MTLSRKIAELIVRKNLSIGDVVEKLQEYGLVPLLPSIREAVLKMTHDKGSEETIRIESPFPLDAVALARIKRIVGNDLANTEVTINKNILAGFKARFKGKLYDGSAERIIRQLTH
jgi:F0F1-type ATP synthase delta subunit